MINKRILDICTTERFKNLAGIAEKHYQAKMEQEIDFGDDIPEEFKGLYEIIFKYIFRRACLYTNG